MNHKNKLILVFSIIFLISLFSTFVFSSDPIAPESFSSMDKNVCAVYFTKLGCPHCAKVDPILFGETVRNEDIVIIEFEVADKTGNAQQIIPYVTGGYKSSYLVPQLILSKDEVYFSEEITSKFNNYLSTTNNNSCSLPADVYADGDTTFSQLKINEISGLPTIWYKDRALFKTGTSDISDENLYKLLIDENIDPIIRDNYHKLLLDTSIEISYGKIEFENAVQLKGYNLYWNGTTTISESCQTEDVNIDQNIDTNCTGIVEESETQKKVSLWTVVSLALVDAVNPCEFAVLILLLLTIMTSNINNRRKILYSGLMFSLAIFVLYFIYGILLVNIFKLIPGVDIIRTVIYKIIAVFALFLATMQLKDYFNYRPGTIGTEMPMSFRPRVQRLISKVTSPVGAFVVGIVVSLFLIPCTIGPYVILSNLLSYGSIVSALPVLLLYNVIFILPMLAITFIIYFGVTEVQKVGEWKKKNIKYFHLVAGIILFILGILMLFGII